MYGRCSIGSIRIPLVEVTAVTRDLLAVSDWQGQALRNSTAWGLSDGLSKRWCAMDDRVTGREK
jgi:hypothetical protein